MAKYDLKDDSVVVVIGSGVTFNPAFHDDPETLGPYNACSVCGDGIRSPGDGAISHGEATPSGKCPARTCQRYGLSAAGSAASTWRVRRAK